MTDEEQFGRRKGKRLWLALAATALLLAVLIVPPMVSISRYKSRITQLISTSLGRPVHLASVELRLLPRPGFVLTDLVVEEDPAYGAEPVLHANTVTASIRLLSLWRGRLEIDTISVDEASLNLVRTPEGRWNLDSLFRTAAAKAHPAATGAGQGRAVPLPYLEATNSRINIKNGVEKLPFSLLNTDLSFWQENPGDWRVRLRGQPARTDMTLDQADTGEVRLEASMRPAPELRQMPLHLDLEWRSAQLGQLTRLLVGSDPGWRGDLTGELHLDGTADAAQIKTRLRATGVHRAEFAPAAPMDFDANCGFVYHYSARALDQLVCDTPLGDGQIRLAGNLPDAAGQPRFSIELERIPVAAALDALRTVRSGFGAGLEVKGTVSGKIEYAEAASASETGKSRSGKSLQTAQGPFTGSLLVEGFQLSGGGLAQPILIPKIVLEPVAASLTQQPALAATLALPAGASAPLAITTRLTASGYQIAVRGQASVARSRELAQVAGLAHSAAPAALDALAGGLLTLDLSAEGPWLSAEKIPVGIISTTAAGSASMTSATTSDASLQNDRLSGTVLLRNATWKADYLANQVEISQATLHLGDDVLLWEPVVFSYGPVKGTASLNLPVNCGSTQPCTPKFQITFGALDASALQAAFLGAHAGGTMLSTLIDRLHPASAPLWPRLEGTVTADSLILGPVTLHGAAAKLRITEHGAEISDLDASLLGGHVDGAGTLRIPEGNQDKPAYTLEARFERLKPQAVGQLIGQRWSGEGFDATGKVALSGFTEKELAATANGTLHFEWRHGSAGGLVPAALARFDRWTADAAIANGTIALEENQIQRGAHHDSVEAAATVGTTLKVTFAAKNEAAKR